MIWPFSFLDRKAANNPTRYTTESRSELHFGAELASKNTEYDAALDKKGTVRLHAKLGRQRELMSRKVKGIYSLRQFHNEECNQLP